MVPGVEVVRSLAGLWSEFMQQRHVCVRALGASAAAIAQVQNVLNSQKCASYKRAQFYAEEAADSGLLWLDFIPDGRNPSDVPKSHVRNIS